MVLLLNEPPKTCKQFILKKVEYIAWTTIFHLFGIIYNEMIGEAYLNKLAAVPPEFL
jgi:membrane-anchored protein YejM (alkaline phosphatase superfamily)